MNVPNYLAVLWRYKWLLIFGLVVALVGGFFAGFRITDEGVESRAESMYAAQTTVMLRGPDPAYYQTEVPAVLAPQTEDVPPIVEREARVMSLEDTALIYAYLASSDEIRLLVEEQIGPLGEGEEIAAVSRTTQPTGDETFPGRLSLPMMNIIGVSPQELRAEEISAVATEVFREYVQAEQDFWGVQEDLRVAMDPLIAGVAEEQDGSNPYIPVVIVFLGIFLIFVALAFAIHGVRVVRRAKAEQRKLDEADGIPGPAPLPTEGADGSAGSERAADDSATDGEVSDGEDPGKPPRRRARRARDTPADTPVESAEGSSASSEPSEDDLPPSFAPVGSGRPTTDES